MFDNYISVKHLFASCEAAKPPEVVEPAEYHTTQAAGIKAELNRSKRVKGKSIKMTALMHGGG